jgi:hypothetical protein
MAMKTQSGRKFLERRQAMLWGVAAVALMVAIVAFAGTFSRADPRTDPRAVTLSSPLAVSDVSHNKKILPLVRSEPVRLVIPALGIDTAVGALGLQPDHQVMVPTSAHVVDWYEDGPTPGQIGSAVILGHVDSFRGPGTFFYLKNLKAGDSITTRLADGAVAHFVVVRVVQYSKTAFPDRLVFGSSGTQSLQLVTCGGTFDHATGHYESNIVVFSRYLD